MKRFTAAISASFLIFLVFGCCTEKLPLCLKLSQTKPSPVPTQRGVGRTLSEVCEKKNIKITVLSDGVAEFKGSKRNMKWLQANYHILLCDFDENSATISAEKAVVCLSKTKEWIQLVQSPSYSRLLDDGTYYCQTCMSGPLCH